MHSRWTWGYVALAAACVVGGWYMPRAFFWRDDWFFLCTMADAPEGFFWRPFFGHLKPLFKAVYYLEAKAFGPWPLGYHLVNLTTLVALGLGFAAVLRRGLGLGPWAAALGMAWCLLHPLHTETVHWFFEICLLLHLALQLWAVYALLRARQAPTARLARRWLALAGLLLVAQHYSFGNGVWVPLLAVPLLWPSRHHGPRALPRWAWALGPAMVAAWLVVHVLVHRAYLGVPSMEGFPDQGRDLLLPLKAPLQALGAWLRLMHYTAARLVWPYPDIRQLPANAWLAVGTAVALVAVALVAWLWRRGPLARQRLLVLGLWFGLVSATIPLMRFPIMHDIRQVFLYYPHAMMLPLALGVVWAVAQVVVALRAWGARRAWHRLGALLAVALVAYTLGLGVLVRKRTNEMARWRHGPNKAAFNKAWAYPALRYRSTHDDLYMEFFYHRGRDVRHCFPQHWPPPPPPNAHPAPAPAKPSAP